MQKSKNYYDDEIRLKDVILKVKELKIEFSSKWKVIFIVSFLFAALGVLYAMNNQENYKAELNFVIEDNSNSGGGLGKYAGLANQFGFDLGLGSSTAFSEGNVLELLKSRRVVEEALLSKVNINGNHELLILSLIHI